jgi:hypothetical protein
VSAQRGRHLVLRVQRKMIDGTYWLSYRVRQGHRWVTKRERITLNW